MKSNRREFLGELGGLAAALGAPGALLSLAACSPAGPGPGRVSAYGPLAPVADQTTGLPLLLLPSGFEYYSFGWTGSTMADGQPTPNRHDGMGIVAEQDGRVTLVRNHERLALNDVIGDPALAYDRLGGGTTTLVFDTNSRSLVDDRVSLSGTMLNCAGGTVPWGSWLSAEEAVWTPEDARRHPLRSKEAAWNIGTAERSHGWVFEVPASGHAEPEPLYDMGQFYHEACAFDPASGYIYQTEDRDPEAGFYRFIPNQPGRLAAGGRLQMLSVQGRVDMRKPLPLGEPMAAGWVDIADPRQGNQPGSNDTAGVVAQGVREGGSVFQALEGCCEYGGRIYFTAKRSGRAACGQVFQYDPGAETLTLLFESPNPALLSGPDNIIFSPRGNLLVCEDIVNEESRPPRLMGLTGGGEYFYLAESNGGLSGSHAGQPLEALAKTEWCGACYSADGRWLFVNLQKPGISFAITGPWESSLA